MNKRASSSDSSSVPMNSKKSYDSKKVCKTSDDYQDNQSNSSSSISSRSGNLNSDVGAQDLFAKSTKFMWDYYAKNAQTLECFRKKVKLKEAIDEILKNVFPYVGVYIVGSSSNGFGTCSSDLDICIVVSHEELNQKTEALWLLRVMANSFRKTSFIRNLKVIAAKVPIIKFHDSVNNLDCDINLNNHIGIRNTHLLKCYTDMDWRVKPLVLGIKRWAKYHEINDASQQTISSYTLTLMTIFFLQNCQPPVVPVLQDNEESKKYFDLERDIRSLKLNETLPVWASSNTESIGELFGRFLDYYSNFKFEYNIISVRKGTILLKQFLPPHLINDHSEWKHLLVEEPFDLSNAARSVFDEYVFKHIKHVFRESNIVYKKSQDMSKLFKEKYYTTLQNDDACYRLNYRRKYEESDYSD